MLSLHHAHHAFGRKTFSRACAWAWQLHSTVYGSLGSAKPYIHTHARKYAWSFANFLRALPRRAWLAGTPCRAFKARWWNAEFAWETLMWACWWASPWAAGRGCSHFMQYIVQNSLLLRFVFLSIVLHAWIYAKFPRASYKVGKGPVYTEGFLHTKHTQAFLRTVVSFFNTLFFLQKWAIHI